MRRATQWMSLAVAVLSTTSPASAPASEIQDAADPVRIANISLEMGPQAAAPDRWKAGIRALARRSPRPEIISLLEVPLKDADGGPVFKRVLRYLNEKLGGGYTGVHIDDVGGNTNKAIVFKSDRFTKQGDVTWGNVVGNDCDEQKANSHFALRLSDAQGGDDIVFAPVHLSVDTTCPEPNVAKVDDVLETKWPTRPLTIVLGDFNFTAVRKADERDVIKKRDHKNSFRSWRRENPELHFCWYRKMSAHHGADDCSDTSDLGYSDVFWGQHGTEGDGSNDLCPQWTYWGSKENEDSVAEQKKGLPDRCTSNNFRIDYLWVRYEDAQGSLVTLDGASLDSKIASAVTDAGHLGKASTKYSSHRALFATIEW